jgi:hypothetical protein
VVSTGLLEERWTEEAPFPLTPYPTYIVGSGGRTLKKPKTIDHIRLMYDAKCPAQFAHDSKTNCKSHLTPGNPEGGGMLCVCVCVF